MIKKQYSDIDVVTMAKTRIKNIFKLDNDGKKYSTEVVNPKIFWFEASRVLNLNNNLPLTSYS